MIQVKLRSLIQGFWRWTQSPRWNFERSFLGSVDESFHRQLKTWCVASNRSLRVNFDTPYYSIGSHIRIGNCSTSEVFSLAVNCQLLPAEMWNCIESHILIGNCWFAVFSSMLLAVVNSCLQRCAIVSNRITYFNWILLVCCLLFYGILHAVVTILACNNSKFD